MEQTYYTSDEVAARLRVVDATVRKWIRQGKLPAVDLAAGSRPGPYRIKREDLEAFEAKQYRPAAGLA